MKNYKRNGESFKRIVNRIEEAFGFEKTENPKPEKKVEYYLGTYFPTGQEPKNYKPSFDNINLN